MKARLTTISNSRRSTGELLGPSQPEHSAKRPCDTVVVPGSDEVCPECGSKMRSEPRPFTSDFETGCSSCGLTKEVDPTLVQLGEFEFSGHAPAESIIMDNGEGCSPGPERSKEAMSALNQDRKSGPTGVNFQIAKLNLLQLWRMSGDETDRIASEILSRTVRKVEKKRGIKIHPARVDGIARACKAGIRKAELKKRLARWELEGAIQGIFKKEGLWPP